MVRDYKDSERLNIKNRNRSIAILEKYKKYFQKFSSTSMLSRYGTGIWLHFNQKPS